VLTRPHLADQDALDELAPRSPDRAPALAEPIPGRPQGWPPLGLEQWGASLPLGGVDQEGIFGRRVELSPLRRPPRGLGNDYRRCCGARDPEMPGPAAVCAGGASSSWAPGAVLKGRGGEWIGRNRARTWGREWGDFSRWSVATMHGGIRRRVLAWEDARAAFLVDGREPSGPWGPASVSGVCDRGALKRLYPMGVGAWQSNVTQPLIGAPVDCQPPGTSGALNA
jgi:hypothetical protein